MPEYRLSLDFTAADDQQAARLAEAWAGTCAAEYGARYAGVEPVPPPTVRHRWWCRLLIVRAWKTTTWRQNGREWAKERCLICRRTTVARGT